MNTLATDFILHGVIPKLPDMLQHYGEDAVWQELHRLIQKKNEDKDLSLHQRVESLVSQMPAGTFSAQHIQRTLQLSSEKERKNVYTILHRMEEKGIVVRDGSKSGIYRKVDDDCLPMFWAEAPTEEYPLELPLDLSNYVKIYPKNIIVMAGVTDVGKTGLCLNIVRDNMKKHEVKYFNSEMGASELRMRLSLFNDISQEEWDFEAFERSDNFEDVIDPNALNIIDYMEVHGEFWSVAQKIRRIYDRLRDGVAVIAIQKSHNAEYGRGATFGAENPRLYVSLDKVWVGDLHKYLQRIKIVKGKNRRDLDVTPAGLIRYYEIERGNLILPFRDWHRWGEYEFERKDRR